MTMKPCNRCGGPKQPGIKGVKHCEECRRVLGDVSAQAERERQRRKSAAALEERERQGLPVRRHKLNCPDNHKWCARCKDYRPLTSFPPATPKGKIASYCMPCQRAYNQERRRMLVYGLTYDEYEMLLACQEYRCAICRGTPRKAALAVDHDHKTGEVRGLLCSRCNHKLLGAAHDDPERLRRAAAYLEEYAPREVFGRPHYVPGFPKPL